MRIFPTCRYQNFCGAKSPPDSSIKQKELIVPYVVEPRNYDLSQHLHRLAETADFKAIARANNVRAEDLMLRLATELRAVVSENSAASLQDVENLIGGRAVLEGDDIPHE